MADYTCSYWEQTSLLAAADYCVIGAGLTGLQTALAIKKQLPAATVLVIERGPFSQGASTRNAGFSCFGSPTELLEDLSSSSAAAVWDTVARRYEGTQRLAQQHGAAVDFQQLGGYEIFYDQAAYTAVLDQLPALNQELARITGQHNVWAAVDSAPGVAANTWLLYNRLEGQLHPGLLVQRLEQQCHAAGIRLLFGLKVEQVIEEAQGLQLRLPIGRLQVGQLVYSTNAFTPHLLPHLDIVPARNQVLLTHPIPNMQLRGCFHRERGYIYFRNVGNDRLLIGGARHLDKDRESTDQFGENTFLVNHLLADLRRGSAYPVAQVDIAYSWSGIIAQGSSKAPIVERISPRQVVAARLAGMGVALSAAIGEQAAVLAVGG